jgi:PilZ domain
LQPHIQREPRYDAHWPLRMGQDSGVTRNLSASGLFFELDASAQPGQTISLCIDLDVVGRKMQWICQAQVVRTESKDGKLGVGARIVSQQLMDCDVVA